MQPLDYIEFFGDSVRPAEQILLSPLIQACHVALSHQMDSNSSLQNSLHTCCPRFQPSFTLRRRPTETSVERKLSETRVQNTRQLPYYGQTLILWNHYYAFPCRHGSLSVTVSGYGPELRPMGRVVPWRAKSQQCITYLLNVMSPPKIDVSCSSLLINV